MQLKFINYEPRKKTKTLRGKFRISLNTQGGLPKAVPRTLLLWVLLVQLCDSVRVLL